MSLEGAAPDGIRAPSEKPKRTAAWIWLAFVAILTFIVFGLPSSNEDSEPLVYSYSFTAAAIFQAVLLIVVAAIIAYVYSAQQWRDTFGFTRFGWRDVRLAAGVTVVSLIAGAIFEAFLQAGDRQGIAADEWDPSRATPFIINALLIIGLGPFVEELFFRGVGVRVLSVFGATAAILVTGVMFALVHGIWEALPALAVFGIGAGYVRYKTKSVYPAFIAHACFNAVGLAVSFAG
jgi:membrane protease YdiL (CAAX protease family)